MSDKPDGPFEQGQSAARKNIPAEGNPYQNGSKDSEQWSAGHEKAAGGVEASEAEGT